MKFNSMKAGGLILAAAVAMAIPTGASAQTIDGVRADGSILVEGNIPADLSGFPDGPELDGIISARMGSRVEVTSDNGTSTVFGLSPATQIRGRGGFLGLNRTEINSGSLLTGLPVTVETVVWEDVLLAKSIRFKNNDLETAAMIHGGTNQRFNRNEAMIADNAAATEALRSRVANIDQYNILDTTNVYFDTGRWNLSAEAENDLCAVANQAHETDNALLLVVGYTDDVGNEEYNQTLSERRAGRVVNYLQQKCDWAPWRMLTPTGMSESDPLADNTTAEGRAQNRRVSVNILVSKAVDGMGG